MRRCQIMVQFECGKKSFFKCKKKEILMHKINTKWYCWMYGARILQKNSPDHLFQVIRWSGAVLTFCSLKKLLLLQKKFIPRWRWSTNFKFVYKKNHTSTGVLSLSYSPVNDFLPACTLAPPGFTFLVESETGDFNTALHFVHFSSTFCPFFKFSFQINPNALKRISYQNNPYIYPGY